MPGKHKAKILLCYWARPRDKWGELVERDSQKILAQASKPVEINLVESIEDLIQKISDADVLYMAGGDAKPIEDLLPQLIKLNWQELLNEKVFIGASMGAFIASVNYILSPDSEDQNTVHQGLGLLDIQTLCHWNAEGNKQAKKDLLTAANPDIPIVTLDEGQFVVFQSN